MKKILKFSSLLLVFTILAFNVSAQKFGYVNAQGLLLELPEVKEMQSNLEALQTQLQKKGQSMVTTYQAEEKKAMEKKERGEMSPIEEETTLKNLQTKQAELMSFEKEMQQKLVEKEQELLKPIYDRVNTAIKDVAGENGYQIIFDSSSGVLLHADETLNVEALVKAKLGI